MICDLSFMHFTIIWFHSISDYCDCVFRRPPAKRRGGNGGKRSKKAKIEPQEKDVVSQVTPEKNGAILAALRKEPAPPVPYQQNANYLRIMNRPGSGADVTLTSEASFHNPDQNFSMAPRQTPGAQFQYTAPPAGGSLPSINASWLSNSSAQTQSHDHSRSSSGMFTPPIASSTPIPFQKSSPLEDLLNEDEPPVDEDGDSRSSSG